jgi:hypothetical protein
MGIEKIKKKRWIYGYILSVAFIMVKIQAKDEFYLDITNPRQSFLITILSAIWIRTIL